LTISRRSFVYSSVAIAAAPCATRLAFALPLGLPLGVQLYSVRQQMAEDLDAALDGISAAGFTEVEAAALPKKPAKEIRAALDKAGLHCVSAHHPFGELQAGFEERITFDKELGAKFVICASPGFRNPPEAGATGPRTYTLDDWQYNAEQFNQMGERAKALGVSFGYHNHTREFVVTDEKTPYLELLRLTDPTKVAFELDCGWAAVAGKNLVELLRDHPYRFSMLHVKDFKLAATQAPEGPTPPVTELGRGSIDYAPVFAQAAKTQRIQHAFVEQEEFDMPWKQSLRIDADYIRRLKA